MNAIWPIKISGNNWKEEKDNTVVGDFINKIKRPLSLSTFFYVKLLKSMDTQKKWKQREAVIKTDSI